MRRSSGSVVAVASTDRPGSGSRRAARALRSTAVQLIAVEACITALTLLLLAMIGSEWPWIRTAIHIAVPAALAIYATASLAEALAVA